MQQFRYFLMILLFITSCNPPAQEQTNDTSLKEEMENREIKKLSEGEINAAAMELGNEVAAKAQETLAGNLKKALQEKGIQGAIKYCNLAAYPLVDSVENEFNAEIKRVSLKTRNPEDKPDQTESSILEAYHYAMEQGQEIGANIQNLNEQYILYTKPIVINNQLCLNCHGEVGENTLTENYQIIKELYPDDEAVGYNMGDLRGMWSIKLAKKEIIKNL